MAPLGERLGPFMIQLPPSFGPHLEVGVMPAWPGEEQEKGQLSLL